MIIAELLFVSVFAVIISKFALRKLNRIIFVVSLSLGILNLLVCLSLLGIGKTKTALSLMIAVTAFISFALGHFIFTRKNKA